MSAITPPDEDAAHSPRSGTFRAYVGPHVVGEVEEHIDAWMRARGHGVGLVGSSEAETTATLRELANLASSGQLEIPIARTYPLERVQDAHRELARRHTCGNIVLTLLNGGD